MSEPIQDDIETVPWDQRKPAKVNVWGLPRDLWLEGLVLLSVEERDRLVAERDRLKDAVSQLQAKFKEPLELGTEGDGE